MKKVVTISLTTALILLLSASVLAASTDGFANFTDSGSYTAGQFRDVNANDWFAPYVEGAYNYGFFQGKSIDTFEPGGLLTLGEAVTLAARLMSIYQTGSAVFPESTPFYSVYADYALSNGIIDGHGDYSAEVTRSRFAELMFRALPAEAFPEVNAISDYAICDVTPDASYGSAVYTLYRAGVLSGSDRFGTFFPDSDITRAEACAVMVRLANPALRQRVALPSAIPAELIFTRSTDAVFLIETFDEFDDSIRTGSGFFISDSGYAVTNLHIFENAARAEITLSCGDVYPIRGAYAVSEENNLVIIAIDSDAGGWSYLNLADSDLIEVGNTVYALGSPLALINTITEGVVSSKSRELDGQVFIQFSAPISFGSAGSPVLNSLGQVIGVASSSFSYGQNLNLAVPVNFIKELTPGNRILISNLNRG